MQQPHLSLYAALTSVNVDFSASGVSYELLQKSRLTDSDAGLGTENTCLFQIKKLLLTARLVESARDLKFKMACLFWFFFFMLTCP